MYRGNEYAISFKPKIKTETFVSDDIASKVISVIIEKARSRKIGDGKIFISTIDDAVRIRTGEIGEIAI